MLTPTKRALAVLGSKQTAIIAFKLSVENLVYILFVVIMRSSKFDFVLNAAFAVKRSL